MTVPHGVRLAVLSAFAATVALSFGSAGAVVEGAVDDFQADLAARVARLRDDTGLTAVAAAVIVDGELAGAAASGERRRDSGISVTVDDRWHMGSITKSMTATLLAVLQEDGLLSSDDALPALLPDIEMADGWGACTLYHLLTHTAGAPANFPSESQEVWPDTPEELVAERRRFIANVLAEEPRSPCGESFAYSNVGYTIAGHIAESIAGEPYQALIQNRVFAPLTLMSTGFGAPRGEYPDQEPVGHQVLWRFRFPVDPFEMRADNTPLIAPAGTVHMKIGDLARYGAVHLQGEYGTEDEPVLLTRSSWQRLHTPFLDDYASGWLVDERDWAGGAVIWHNGSNSLWYALLMLLPSSNTVLAFVTNDGVIEAADRAFVELAEDLSTLVKPGGTEADMQPSGLAVRYALFAAAVFLALAPLPAGAQDETSAPFVPVTDAMLEDPAPGDWLTWRRTPDGWGYSPLDQIDRENVGTLRLVWTRALGVGNQEGTPLAYGGVLYMPNPSDVIQAIDAATGDLRWEYRRDLPDDIDDYVNGSMTNRNIAIYGNRILDTSADNYLYALDAETGRLAWETQILDYFVNPARHSSGPIVAGGKAVSGRSCRPHGGPEACVITAHDAETGVEVWRTRLVPAPGEPGDETWGGVPYEERVHVGSWMAPSYDPELNLVYVGTSVTSPAPKFLLGGIENNYLYHNSTLALDGDTGEIVWYYQHLNDHWDLDHPFERLLVDTAVAPDPAAVSWINPRLNRGEVRKVLTGIPGKTGVVYTLDRETGEFLWARPTVTQNVISAIDGATGAVTENAELIFTAEGQEVLTCPTWFGGKDWEAGAYSPRTNRMYMPLRNTCARMMATREARIHYALALRHQLAPGTDQLGTIQAISAETGATEWLYEQRAATMSLVATGGGLVFGGDTNGRFRAHDDETGEVLWEINLGSPVSGFPITYAVDGRQYVAVSTGASGTASGFTRLTPELRPSVGNNLFVFALP